MRAVVNAILCLGLLFSLGARASDLMEMESSNTYTPKKAVAPSTYTTPYNMIIQAPVGEENTIISVTEYPESSTAQVEKILNDPNLKQADVLLSTDQEEIVKTAIDATSSPSEKRLLRIMPIGKLAAAKEQLASGFKNYYKNVKSTLRGDRIGLTVLAITAGFDSFIWIHSANLDIHQKSAMVLMNLVMAATFGLDRDLWGKINKPLKTKMIKVFDRFIPSEKFSMIKTLSSQYLSNMFLGMGIQLIRTGLLSVEHINSVVTTMPYWLNAAKLSGLVTLTTFAWSELYSSVEAEKSPVAKMMLKRLGEMRGIIMCQLASISMVLQPHVYGNMPIYSYVIHGALGIIALANAHRIVEWFETNSVIQKFYKKIQTFENYINSGLDTLRDGSTVMSCRSLFAN